VSEKVKSDMKIYLSHVHSETVVLTGASVNSGTAKRWAAVLIKKQAYWILGIHCL